MSAAASSTIPLFGRKYELQVETQSHGTIYVANSTWEPEALRITFDIQQPPQLEAFWYADISVYNMNASTMQIIVEDGDLVTLKAGYQNGDNYGVIFQGKVFQPMWERVNVTDYKFTMRCIVGRDELFGSIMNFSQTAGATQWDIVMKMARDSGLNVAAAPSAQNKLSQTRLPRGKVVFGNSRSTFGEMFAQHNMSGLITGVGQIGVGDYVPRTTDPDIVYGPAIPPGNTTTQNEAGISRTILGTPQQTQEGVAFRVLLDSRLLVKPNAWLLVRLDQTIIKQFPTQVGSLPPVLSASGNYIVGSVRHVGDSRGDAWYTEAMGYLVQQEKFAMLGLNQNLDVHSSGPSK